MNVMNNTGIAACMTMPVTSPCAAETLSQTVAAVNANAIQRSAGIGMASHSSSSATDTRARMPRSTPAGTIHAWSPNHGSATS